MFLYDLSRNSEFTHHINHNEYSPEIQILLAEFAKKVVPFALGKLKDARKYVQRRLFGTGGEQVGKAIGLPAGQKMGGGLKQQAKGVTTGGDVAQKAVGELGRKGGIKLRQAYDPENVIGGTTKQAAKKLAEKVSPYVTPKVKKQVKTAATEKAFDLLSEKYPRTAKAIEKFPKVGEEYRTKQRESQDWIKENLGGKPRGPEVEVLKYGVPKTAAGQVTPTVAQALKAMGPEGQEIMKILETRKVPSFLELGRRGLKTSAEAINPLEPEKMAKAFDRGRARQQLASSAWTDVGGPPTLHQQASDIGLRELGYNLGPGMIGAAGGGIEGAKLGLLLGGPAGVIPGTLGGAWLGETGAVSAQRFGMEELPKLLRGTRVNIPNWEQLTPGQRLMAIPGGFGRAWKDWRKGFDPTEYQHDAVGPVIGAATAQLPLGTIPGVGWAAKQVVPPASAIIQTAPVNKLLQETVRRGENVPEAFKKAYSSITNVMHPWKKAGLRGKIGDLRKGREIIQRGIERMPSWDEYKDLPVSDPRVQRAFDRLGIYYGRTLGKGSPQQT